MRGTAAWPGWRRCSRWRVAANHLGNFGIGRYAGSVTSTSSKVTGVDLFSVGNFAGGDDCEGSSSTTRSAASTKKLVLKENRVVGGVMVGDTKDEAWYFQLLKDGRDVHGSTTT